MSGLRYHRMQKQVGKDVNNDFHDFNGWLSAAIGGLVARQIPRKWLLKLIKKNQRSGNVYRDSHRAPWRKRPQIFCWDFIFLPSSELHLMVDGGAPGQGVKTSCRMMPGPLQTLVQEERSNLLWRRDVTVHRKGWWYILMCIYINTLTY